MNIRLALTAVAAGTLLAGSALADKGQDKAKAYDSPRTTEGSKAYEGTMDKSGKTIGLVNAACTDDARKFCADKIKDDAGDAKSAAKNSKKVFDCLDENKNDLAQSCRDYVDTFAACKKDFDKHCKDQNIFTDNQCLSQKRTDLSEKCRTEWDKYAQNQADPTDLGICRKEFERYCADVKPGSGQEWNCLSTNRVYLSESCRKDLDKRGSGSGTPQGTGVGNEGYRPGSGGELKGTEGYEGTGSSGSGTKSKGHTHDEIPMK